MVKISKATAAVVSGVGVVLIGGGVAAAVALSGGSSPAKPATGLHPAAAVSIPASSTVTSPAPTPAKVVHVTSPKPQRAAVVQDDPSTTDSPSQPQSPPPSNVVTDQDGVTRAPLPPVGPITIPGYTPTPATQPVGPPSGAAIPSGSPSS